MKLRIIELTIVVSAMDPKLLIKMLQVTFTGGPAERKRGKDTEKLDFITNYQHSTTEEKSIRNSREHSWSKKDTDCTG